MSTHPLNFRVVVITPLELLFWPIYSFNFTHLPNHYLCKFAVKILTENTREMHVMLKIP